MVSNFRFFDLVSLLVFFNHFSFIEGQVFVLVHTRKNYGAWFKPTQMYVYVNKNFCSSLSILFFYFERIEKSVYGSKRFVYSRIYDTWRSLFWICEPSIDLNQFSY